jgi:hypothetical protein
MTTEKVDPTVESEKESNPRQDLHEKMEAMKEDIEGHMYLDAVYEVNKMLIEQDKEIGPNMIEAVHINLEEIRSGTGSLPTYHAREVGAMVKDGVEELRKGNYEQAALNGAGAVVNSAAFFASGAHQTSQHKLGRSIHGSREESSDDNRDDSTPSSEGNGCSLM